jgi:hypothetical protein
VPDLQDIAIPKTYGENSLSGVFQKMNIEHFTKHIASRKAEPIAIELKESKIEIPPDYRDAKLKINKNKARGQCSLQEATIVSCEMEGERQWISMTFNNEFEDKAFLAWFNELSKGLIESMGEAPEKESKNLLLSRYQRDYTGKTRVPIRLWKMDRTGTLQEYEGCLSEGTVVICSFEELRAYCKKGTNEIKVAADLHRDILVVRKSNKRRRVVQYFSDGE